MEYVIDIRWTSTCTSFRITQEVYQTQDNRGASNARDLCTYQECVQTENSTACKKCKGLCCCRPLQIPVGMMKYKPGNLVLYNISLVSSYYVVHVSNINTNLLDKNPTNIWLLSSVGNGTFGILSRVRWLCSRSNLQGISSTFNAFDWQCIGLLNKLQHTFSQVQLFAEKKILFFFGLALCIRPQCVITLGHGEITKEAPFLTLCFGLNRALKTGTE